ncbi:MAG: trypsin-like serine peptidase, partial [Planctomycetota bacterium]
IAPGCEQFCCEPPYAPGDRVVLLVDNPSGAAGLLTGHCGTVICCDYDDLSQPVMVSWDNWANGHNSDGPCESAIHPYQPNTGWWMQCPEIAPGGVQPDPPANPSPADGEDCAPTDATLCWNGASAKSGQPAMPKLIYGADDRLDCYQVSDPAILGAGDATVAVMSRSNLIDNGNGTFDLAGCQQTLAQYYLATRGTDLCSYERFRDQLVTGAWCSGVLVAPDIVATAGHCIENSSDCANTAFVFGLCMLGPTTPVCTVDASQVYYCTEIIGREQTAAGCDWALVRLDRPVPDHTPVAVRRSGTVPNGEPLLVIGHPVTLFRKYAGGATVRDNSQACYFEANLDTYGGNSGSPVLSANTMLLEGLLVRGNVDFLYDSINDCDYSNVCPDTGCPGWEEVTRATVFSNLLPGYDVYFGIDPGNMSLICQGIVATCCDPGPLQPGTTYHWQVVAKGVGVCGDAYGPVWSFTTRGYPGTCWSCLECAGQPDGDSTCDGLINLADLFALKAHFGKCAPWIPPECCSDYDHSGCINLADLFALKAGFGTSGYIPSTGSQSCP